MMFFSIFISIAIVPIACGYLALLLWGKRNRNSPVTGLMFHSVGNKKSWGVSYYPVSRFEQFINELNSHNIPCKTLTETYQLSSVQNFSDMKILCITFDDGFSDFYEFVLPLLSKHSIKVTIFPIAGFIGKKVSWDVFPAQQHMDKNQLKEIASLGHEIGSHSLTHADLTLLNKTELIKELSESKMILEDILGSEVNSVSFPFGRWNGNVWDTAQNCGYRTASIYGRVNKTISNALFPMTGVYAFDSVDSIIEKTIDDNKASIPLAQSFIMPHYAKGSSLWIFRKEYSLLQKSESV